MDAINLARGKELFFNYCGNFFHMSRAGDYKEYKTYGISKEQELVWKNELVEQLYYQVSFDNNWAFLKLSTLAANYHDYSIVERLNRFIVENLDKGDSLMKLVYAETMLNIPCPKEITKIKIDSVVQLLNSVSNNPITVNSAWLQRGFPNLPDEKYIVDRLQKDIEKVANFKKTYHL